MIECIFTVDYEIYGNGAGSLSELVLQPTESLMQLFESHNSRFVTFVEVAELEAIENAQSDVAIGPIKDQIRRMHRDGFELGLHIHPQWCNAEYENGVWHLDYDEYNLCALRRERIEEIVGRSIDYLRRTVGDGSFNPLAFRAGNWLFQPTAPVAGVLKEKGIRLDSSVFKGGLQRQHGLDYRKALGNDYWWRFQDRVDVPDQRGALIEMPIYTEMVPFWRMATSKRLAIQRKPPAYGNDRRASRSRVFDFLRPFYPLKLDFCRMTFRELTHMFESIVRENRRNPDRYLPIVAIGHSKDLVDFDTVDKFVSYLLGEGVSISTFSDAYVRHGELLRTDATSGATTHAA